MDLAGTLMNERVAKERANGSNILLLRLDQSVFWPHFCIFEEELLHNAKFLSTWQTFMWEEGL